MQACTSGIGWEKRNRRVGKAGFISLDKTRESGKHMSGFLTYSKS